MKKTLFLLSVAASMALLIWGTWHAFYVAPLEQKMGFVQKIFYYHVPVAWVMFLAVGIAAGGSIGYLITKGDRADRAASAAAELAVLFGVMVLITGPLWAWKAWGKPWTWDVKLTATLLLWLVLVAYLVIRAYGGPGSKGLSAGLAIFGVMQVPLIYFAVDLWRSSHPERLVAKSGGLDPEMRTALFICAFAFIFIFAAIYSVRLRVGRDQARLDELHLLAEEVGLEDL